MAFKRITDSEGWNEEVLRKRGSFLQSWEWGTFQESVGRTVERYRDASDGSLMQAIRMPLPMGKHYWYVPRGPLGGDAAPAFTSGVFVRVESVNAPSEGKKVASVQPSQTLILDLASSEEELLAGMHEKTRYNIRLAERKGVKVFPASTGDDGFEVFWQLVEETSERAGIKSHDKDYYRKMLKTMDAKIFFAEHDGKVLAAVLMIYFGERVTYLHGASSRTKRELMAPHLLHWHVIKDAKERGLKEYDFWGVAPLEEREGKLAIKDPKHAWAGITRFKKGFGGAYVEYPGTFDLPLNAFWYTLYRVVKSLR